MKPVSALFCGTLLACFSSWGLNKAFTVTQTPSRLTVTEGQTVQIKCCWNESIQHVKVNWLKNNNRTNYSSTTKTYENNCALFTIENAAKKDAGSYVCKVIKEIPVLTEVKGNATELIVHEKNELTTTASASKSSSTGFPSKNSSESPDWILPVALAAATGVVAICVSVSLWNMKKTCQKTERVVIHEAPHNEDEELEHAEESEHSADSSRGSAHWCEVPVYWSYFDVSERNDCENAG